MDTEIIQNMINNTDMNNWYWLSYGEKCYAFAVVSAYPVEDNVPCPQGGGELTPHFEKEYVWLTECGVEMYVDEFIAERESQNGNTICRFIAQAYTEILKDYLPTQKALKGEE